MPERNRSPFSSDDWWYDDGYYDDDWDDDSDSGLGAYGVAGIEALRLTESRSETRIANR